MFFCVPSFLLFSYVRYILHVHYTFKYTLLLLAS